MSAGATEVYDPEYDWCATDGVDVSDAAPDPVGRVIEMATRIAVLAAEQLEWVVAVRDAASVDAGHRHRVGREIVERSVRLEIAAALRITEYRAGTMLALAESLVHRYPAVLASLRGAGITVEHAEILVGGVDAVDLSDRESVLGRGLATAEVEAVGTFRRSMKRLVETVRADTLSERHESAVRTRRVVVETVDDAMAWLHWYGPAVEVHAAFSRLTKTVAVLRTGEDEERTLDQLRSDVLGDLLVDGETTSLPRDARGVRATVVVTVPVLALRSDDLAVLSRCEQAMVQGIGPVPLATARELAGGASGWTRVLTHPETGMVLSVGREQYRPPPSLAKLVKWRADRCMAPGCGMPAARCQIDHTIAWENGGATELGNLAPMCQGHHTIKHHGGWVVRQVEDGGGTLEWTSPSGRRYVVRPERRMPVFRSTGDETSAPF